MEKIRKRFKHFVNGPGFRLLIILWFGDMFIFGIQTTVLEFTFKCVFKVFVTVLCLLLFNYHISVLMDEIRKGKYKE